MRFVVVLFFLSTLASCSKEDSHVRRGFVYNLGGKAVDLDSTVKDVMDPFRLFFIDSLIVSYNWNIFPKVFTVLDVRNHKVLGTFGNFEDESESNKFSFYPYLSNHKRSIEGSGMGVNVILNVDSMLSKDSPRLDTLVFTKNGKLEQSDFTSSDSTFCIGLWNINDSLYLADGLFPDGKRLGLYTNEGKLLSTYFSYPDSLNNINPRLKAFTFFHLFASHPTNDVFVNVYTESDWIEIIKVENRSLKHVYRGFTHLPMYEVFNEVATRTSKKTIAGNIDLDVTQDRVLVLRSDKTIEESMRGNRIFWAGSDIIVYDWNGNLLGRLQLDREIEKFCISEKEHAIYAYVRDPNPALIVYELPHQIFEPE